eukprot:SAG31_NODE_10066_length_1188_cov_1.440771_2_plen_197_part_00
MRLYAPNAKYHCSFETVSVHIVPIRSNVMHWQVAFHGQRLTVRTLQAVPAGTELTIGYVELYAPRPERRAQLEASKGFVCECSRCLKPDLSSEKRLGGGTHLSEKARQAAVDVKEDFDGALAAYQAGDLRTAEMRGKAALRKAQESGELSGEHWVVVDLHKLLLDVYTSAVHRERACASSAALPPLLMRFSRVPDH